MISDTHPALKPVSIGKVIGLSLLTFGIYGMYRFYQCCKGYKALVPERPSGFEWQFWTFLGLGLTAGFLCSGFLQWLVGGASLFTGAVLLANILSIRTTALRVRGSTKELTSTTMHVGLWVTGQATGRYGVGIPLILFQAVKFFDDHNRFVAELDLIG